MRSIASASRWHWARGLGVTHIEREDARTNARLLPLVIFVTGRHECKLSRVTSHRRSGCALNEGPPLMSGTSQRCFSPIGASHAPIVKISNCPPLVAVSALTRWRSMFSSSVTHFTRKAESLGVVHGASSRAFDLLMGFARLCCA
jgi:hypothetical protein